MALGPVISSDSHVNEPEAAWERIPRKLRERGPHYVQNPPGKKGLYLIIEGHRPDPVGQTFLAGTGRDPAVVKDRIENFTWDRWRGPWDAKERLADMDLDGVWLEILYPSLARNLYSLSGDELPLQLAGIQSYNDWLLDFCDVAPDRLVPLAMVSALDVAWSVKELQRARDKGHKGFILPAALPKGMSYADAVYEPLWEAAEALDFPVHFHINIKQSLDREAQPKINSLLEAGSRSVSRNILEAPHLMRDLLFGLVFERHPRLRTVFAEYELHWILPFLNRFENEGRRFAQEYPGVQSLTATPSEIIRRQVFVTFQNDVPGLGGAEAAGILDNVMWASDYPHGGATWPDSQNILDKQLSRLAPELQRKLVWDTAAKFYGIKSAPVALKQSA